MRILAGEARGRVLHSPSGRGTRPTDARAREALFNILGERIIGARILDLYAGSGSIGMEALSRGADFCIFVEQNAGAASAIRANLKMCRWDDKEQPRGQVWQTNVKGALLRLDEQKQHFDIIFADPPFTNAQVLEDITKRVDTFRRLLHNVEEVSAEGQSRRSSGLFVVQHQYKTSIDLSPQFAMQKSRRTGESLLSFFEPACLAQVDNLEAGESEFSSDASNIEAFKSEIDKSVV